jgi:hypothetical protein
MPTDQRDRALALTVEIMRKYSGEPEHLWVHVADLIEAALSSAYTKGFKAAVDLQDAHDEQMARKYERQNPT